MRIPYTQSARILAVLLFFFCVSVGQARADYYAQGILESTNVLSGATVTAISGFQVTSTIPANTTVKIKFSQDRVNYYNSSGTKEGFDTCTDGVTNVNLTGLGWTGGALFYKIQFESIIDPALTPAVSEISVGYTGSDPLPPSGINYPPIGTVLSTDLLSGSGIIFNDSERFAYAISFLPYGMQVYAQFSQDGVNFYNSSGTLWGEDTLVTGSHLATDTALDLQALHWKGATSFYYKLRFTDALNGGYSPIVTDAGLIHRSTTVSIAGRTVTVNDSQINKLTSGLVGIWSFNGPDVSGTTAYDRSGQGNNGTLVSGPTVTPGMSGQALSFNGTSQYISNGIGYNGLQSISFWAKPNSTTQSLFDLNGTQTVDISAGTVRGNSFTSPTIYIDGVASAAFPDTDWHFVTLTTGTGIDASAFNIGKITSSYFSGKIDEVRIYNRALTASEIGELYRMSRVTVTR